MTQKPFEIQGLGKCLVGTYTIRNLTKYFQCSPEQLLLIGSQSGNEYEFNSYLLKYSHENFLVQSKGAAGLKEKSIIEIDLILDEHPLQNTDFDNIVNALCLCIYGISKDEYIKKIQEAIESETKVESEEETEKKSLTIPSSGETLIKSHGETE